MANTLRRSACQWGHPDFTSRLDPVTNATLLTKSTHPLERTDALSSLAAHTGMYLRAQSGIMVGDKYVMLNKGT